MTSTDKMCVMLLVGRRYSSCSQAHLCDDLPSPFKKPIVDQLIKYSYPRSHPLFELRDTRLTEHLVIGAKCNRISCLCFIMAAPAWCAAADRSFDWEVLCMTSSDWVRTEDQRLFFHDFWMRSVLHAGREHTWGTFRAAVGTCGVMTAT